MSGVGVSFDLDATLLDNSFIPTTIAACCRFVAGRLGIEEDEVAAANAAAFSATWREAEAALAIGSLSGREMIRAVWGQVLAACGGDDGDVLDALVAEHLRLDRINARLFADVRPAIDELRGRGIPLALITNGSSDTQRARLDSLGMTSWFAAVVISGEVGAVKPAGELFDLAARALGADGRDLWHVGDNLATDVAGARAAGHTAVWLNRQGGARRPGDPEPDLELASLAELPAALP